MGGMTCDDGNVLAYAFDSISIAYAKCTLGEKFRIVNFLSMRFLCLVVV